jgi:hypothetical protein
VNKKLDQLICLLNENLRLFLSISFGVFLFVLFFQPFPISRFDFNNNLLFVAGLGAIVFLFMFLVRVVLFRLFQNNRPNNHEPVLPSYMGGFLILALNSVAFAFYLRYVGFVSINFYIMFKVVLICLAPSLVLGLYDVFKELRLQNHTLIIEKKILQKEVEKYEEDYLNKSIEFTSENSSEHLSFLIADVAFVRSADNYVEIVYKEGEIFKNQLIRNTLKNIELQLKPYSHFIRVHRICIVNAHYIEKLHRNYSKHWLTLKGNDKEIPVSRQYLLKIKETI